MRGNRGQPEVLAHVQDEEGRLFPLLGAACSERELDALGDRVRRARRTPPTRPHPAAPGAKPGGGHLAPGAGLVDRLRDLLGGRGRHAA